MSLRKQRQTLAWCQGTTGEQQECNREDAGGGPSRFWPSFVHLHPGFSDTGRSDNPAWPIYRCATFPVCLPIGNFVRLVEFLNLRKLPTTMQPLQAAARIRSASI